MDEYFVEEKSAGDKLLDLLVFLAVFVVTIFLILEILGLSGKTGIDVTSVNEAYIWVSVIVFIIFIADLIRLWHYSNGVKDFFSHNWLDVLATIPFELIALALASVDPSSVQVFGLLKWFRFHKLSRIGKLQRISRISKVSKEFKAASHLKKEGTEYRKKHRL
jgi:hypothetical protein